MTKISDVTQNICPCRHSECDFMGHKCLCRYKVTNLRGDPSELGQDLNSTAGVLLRDYKGEDRDREEKTKAKVGKGLDRPRKGKGC